jgi:hypothetical protein
MKQSRGSALHPIAKAYAPMRCVVIEPTPAHSRDSGMLARCGDQQIEGADVDGRMEEVDQYADRESDTLSDCGAWTTLPMDHTWLWEHSLCDMRIRICQLWLMMDLGSSLSTCSDVASLLDSGTCSCSMDQHSGCSCQVPCLHTVRARSLDMKMSRHTSEPVLADDPVRSVRAENLSASTHLNHSRLLHPARRLVRAWA